MTQTIGLKISLYGWRKRYKIHGNAQKGDIDANTHYWPDTGTPLY